MVAVRPLKKYFLFISLSLNYSILLESVTLSKSINVLRFLFIQIEFSYNLIHIKCLNQSLAHNKALSNH